MASAGVCNNAAILECRREAGPFGVWHLQARKSAGEQPGLHLRIMLETPDATITVMEDSGVHPPVFLPVPGGALCDFIAPAGGVDRHGAPDRIRAANALFEAYAQASAQSRLDQVAQRLDQLRYDRQAGYRAPLWLDVMPRDGQMLVLVPAQTLGAAILRSPDAHRQTPDLAGQACGPYRCNKLVNLIRAAFSQSAQSAQSSQSPQPAIMPPVASIALDPHGRPVVGVIDGITRLCMMDLAGVRAIPLGIADSADARNAVSALQGAHVSSGPVRLDLPCMNSLFRTLYALSGNQWPLELSADIMGDDLARTLSPAVRNFGDAGPVRVGVCGDDPADPPALPGFSPRDGLFASILRL